jgi:hypothetical protein
MKAKLSDRRAPYGETQRAVLQLLRTEGPKQRWQISAAIGKKCDTTIISLLKSGNVEQYQDTNEHPDPTNKVERIFANYVAFVRDLDTAPRKGVSETSMKWAAKVLRAAGWSVEPPKLT